MIYYLGARFSKISNYALSNFRKNNTLSIKGQYSKPKLGFHTTIVYSHLPFCYQISQLPDIILHTKNVALFNRSLVLTLDKTEWLYAQHNKCLENGATSDFEYCPHITFGEEVTEYKINYPILLSIQISEIFYREWKD
jgi:hypothetical protein